MDTIATSLRERCNTQARAALSGAHHSLCRIRTGSGGVAVGRCVCYVLPAQPLLVGRQPLLQASGVDTCTLVEAGVAAYNNYNLMKLNSCRSGHVSNVCSYSSSAC
jgi:hypothetical protein